MRVGARSDARARVAYGLDGVGAPWLIVIGGCVLLALSWAGVLYKIAAEARLEKEVIERRTMNLARVFEEHTIRTLAAVDQALLFVKFQYEKEGDALDIGSAVTRGMIVSTLYNQVGVIDAAGIYHLSSLPGFSRVDLSDREHFRVHTGHDSRSFFVSKPVLGRASGKWSVQMTRRINLPDGGFGGVAVISIDPSYLTTFYADVDIGKRGVVTLFGLDGIVRARQHELRTPLNGIIGYAELLKELSREAELRGYAGVIFDSSQHLLALLNSRLDLARVEAGKVSLSYAAHELGALVEEVGATYGALAQAEGLELVCTAPAGAMLECDHVWVVQTLNDLVHNALKFTESGGASLSARIHGGHCVFEVRDTGCGIPAELHDAIFERFRQVDAFETRSQGGTGLGLALCRELAELMGGKVSVRSAPRCPPSIAIPRRHCAWCASASPSTRRRRVRRSIS